VKFGLYPLRGSDRLDVKIVVAGGDCRGMKLFGKQHAMDLTQGSLAKQILQVSLPLMAINVLQVLFNMADLAVVGRFAGSVPLGAVGSTSKLIFLFTGLLIGVSGGVNVLVARHFGARDRERLTQTVHTAAIVCLAMGSLLLVVGVVFARNIMELLNTKPELIDSAVLYLRIYVLGMPALGLYNFGNAVFSAVGDTRRPLYYMVVAGAVNVALNVFFVVVCGMDVDGVGLASAISQAVSAVLVVRALFRCDDIFGLRLADLRMDTSCAGKILSIGIPSGLQNAIFSIANLFIQTAVNSFSAITVAGIAAAANADDLTVQASFGFCTACSSFVGQNYGARKKERIIKSYIICTAYAFGLLLVMGILLFVFSEQFLYLFTDDPAVVAEGLKRLRILALFYCVAVPMDCSIAASRGLGKTVVPTIIVVLGACVFRIIWVKTIFAFYGTITSLFLLYIFSWIITATIEVWYFLRIYRRETREM